MLFNKLPIFLRRWMPVPDQTSPQPSLLCGGCPAVCWGVDSRLSVRLPRMLAGQRRMVWGGARPPASIHQYSDTFSVLNIGLKALNNFNCFDRFYAKCRNEKLYSGQIRISRKFQTKRNGNLFDCQLNLTSKSHIINDLLAFTFWLNNHRWVHTLVTDLVAHQRPDWAISLSAQQRNKIICANNCQVDATTHW